MLNEAAMLSEIEFYKNQLGYWNIVENKLVKAPFTLGYYQDKSDKLWKTYKVGERGEIGIFDEEEDKLKILDDFLVILEYRYRVQKRKNTNK